MADKQKPVSGSGAMVSLLVFLNAIFIKAGYTSDEKWYGCLIISLPLLIWAIVDIRREKRAIARAVSGETEAKAADLKSRVPRRLEDDPGPVDEILVAPPEALKPAANN